jgi:ketosteroid isomerase-like protein
MQAQQRKPDLGDRRSSIADVVRRCFRAYETADRAVVEALLADDFTFTSPYDDHIGRATYFERCFPQAGTFERFELQQVTVDGDACVVVYNGERKHGGAFHNTERFVVVDGKIKSVEVFFGLPPNTPPEPDPQAAERAIRQLLEQRERGFRSKDAAAVARLYTDDAISYGLAPPLRLDAAASRDPRRLAEWFATWNGPVETELRELRIEARGSLGFATALQRLVGTQTDGTRVDMWMRATYTFRQDGGGFKISSSHESVPFAMDGSFRAQTDLEP